MKRFFAALLLFTACTRSGGESAPPGKRVLPPPLLTAARSFGDAVLAKDYVSAYDMMAASYRQELPYPEFLKSIARYRDHAEGELKVDVRASDDDPKTLKDDGMVQMLVPEPLRGQILDEAILAFDLAKSGEDAEGGWVLVLWLTEEAGQVRVLNYYQDD